MEWLNWFKRNSPNPKPVSAEIIDSIIVVEELELDAVFGRELVAIWSLSWTSAHCEQTIFAYEIAGVGFVVFPGFSAEGTKLIAKRIEVDNRFKRVESIAYFGKSDSKIWGETITSIYAPEDPGERLPDSHLIWLASNVGLSQESDAPIGCLPAIFGVREIPLDYVRLGQV